MTTRIQFKSVLKELISGIAIIYAALWLGQWLSELTGDLMPASIIGMLMLAVALHFGLINPIWVERSAHLFLRWMSLLFVPIGVGLVEHVSTLQSALVAILLTCVVATLGLLALVGWSYQKVESLKKATK